MSIELPHVARVLDAEKSARAHIHLRLERPSGFSHTVGQYVMAKLPGDADARPLVLAARDEAPHLELLIRTPDDDAAGSFVEGALGGEVSFSDAVGPGLNVEDTIGHPLWLFAAGSAIAAIRPVLQWAAATPEGPSSVRLFYGVHNDDYVCFADDLNTWRGRGFDVVIVQSDPEAGSIGQSGFVQDHIAGVPADLRAFVIGMPEMEAAVRAQLETLGVAAERISNNF